MDAQRPAICNKNSRAQRDLKLARYGTKGTNDGTLFKEVVIIDFSVFCGAIYPKCPQIRSQGMFVSRLFVAGGSQFLSAATTADKDYQKKLYNRAKPLTQNLKGSFPKPINTEGVIAFFATQVEKSYVRDVMTAFAIPTTIVPDVFIVQSPDSTVPIAYPER